MPPMSLKHGSGVGPKDLAPGQMCFFFSPESLAFQLIVRIYSYMLGSLDIRPILISAAFNKHPPKPDRARFHAVACWMLEAPVPGMFHMDSIWISWKLKKPSVGIVGHYDISCFGISLQMVVWFWTIPTSSIMPLSKKPSSGKISGFWKRPRWHWRCCPSSQRRGEKPDCPGLQGIRILFGGFPCISFYVLYGGFRKWGCPKSSKTLDHVSLNPFGSIWTMLVYVSIKTTLNPWWLGDPPWLKNPSCSARWISRTTSNPAHASAAWTSGSFPKRWLL